MMGNTSQSGHAKNGSLHATIDSHSNSKHFVPW